MGLLFTLSVNAQQITPTALSTCLGDSVELTATPNDNNGTYRYIWSNNLPDTNVVVVMPNTTTTYTVTILIDSSSFYIGQATVTITVNQLPNATATTNSPVCAGQTIQFNTGNGMSSYQWGGPNGFSSSLQNPSIPNANSSMWADYGLTVTDANGCTDSVTFNVVVNPLPIASITVSPNDTVCQAVPVTLTGIGGVSYLWNNTQTTQAITQTLTTVGNTPFSVNVTGANGCSSTANQTIVVRPNPLAIATGTNASCNGVNDGSATVNAFFGSPFTYIWNTSSINDSITGLSPAIYSVTVTNVYGCSATDTATVGQPTALTAAISGQTNVNCNGGNNGTATVIPNGGTAPYSYSWTGSGVGTNPRIGLTAGSYTVTVMDANLCTTTATVTITEPQVLTANADSTSVTCFGDNDGDAFVSFINGGTSPYTYLWNNGGTNSSITSLTAGNYSVTITDANNCTVSAATAVTQPIAITLSAQSTSVTCNGGNNGSINLTVTGGTSPYTYLWSNGFTGQDPQGLVAGTDTVMITDDNGCTAIGFWVVNQPTALAPTINTTNATCFGNGNGSASVGVSGGTAPYGYVWNNGATTNSINAPAGNYTVTITDGNGCQVAAFPQIGSATPIGASGIITPISCYAGNNGAIDLTVTGVSPFTYAWSNGAITQDLSGLGWGNYDVTVTSSANGCDTSLNFILSQPVPFTAQASATNPLCFGGTGSATVMALGGAIPYSFQWLPSGGTGNTATNLADGSYTAVVTDANGCQVQASTVVIQPSQLTAVISSQQNIACAGNSNGSATASVTGGTPFSGGSYNFLWSNGSQLNQAFGLTAGNHTVTITDANGCTAATTATISTTGSSLYANMTSETSCGNSNTGSVTASVSGGQQPYQYQWSNGATSPIVSGLAPGNYSVTITDANGCNWQGSQQILGSPAIVVNLTSQVLCEGNNDVVNATFSGGTWPYQFTWTSPLGNLFTTQGINPSQEGVYELLIVDNFGCTGYGVMPVDLISCNTGIGDIDNEGINIFPNPISSGQELTLQLPSNIQEVEIRVVDFVGKTVFQGRTNETLYKVSTSDLAVGAYMVQVAAVDGSAFIRRKITIE